MNDFIHELSLENFQFNYDNMVAEEFFVQSILNLKLRALKESNYIVIQEGFVDTVKKTLRKIFEAVVNFFKKIIGFFRRDKSEIKQLEKDINVLSKKCEKLEKMENQNNKNQISRIAKKDDPLGLPNYGDKQYDVSYHYSRYFFDKYGDAIYDLEELYFNTKIIKVYDTFSDELFLEFSLLNSQLSKGFSEYPNLQMDQLKKMNKIFIFNHLGKDKNISYDEDTSYEEFGRKYSSSFIVKKGKEFFIEKHVTLNNVIATASMVLKDATEAIQETEKKLNTDIKGIDKELETLNRSMDKFKNYEDPKDDQPIDTDSFKEIISASSKFCSILKGVATIQYIFCNYITNVVSNNVNYIKKYVKEVGVENYINTSGAYNNL